MDNFFTSDTHFGHTNVLMYDKREYKNIIVHDEDLISKWNETVKDNNIYFLGDFGLSSPGYLETIMNKLSGNKFFIKGNHDKKPMVHLYKKYGTFLGNLEEVVIEGKNIVLCHYALRTWRGSGRGSYHLYGHSHDNLDHTEYGKSMDCGVQSAYRLFKERRPISFNEINNILKGRELTFHHTRD